MLFSSNLFLDLLDILSLQVQALPNQCIAIVPPLDLTLDDAERAAKALRTVLGA